MFKFTAYLSLLSILTTQLAWGITPARVITADVYQGGKNLLLNPSFDAGTFNSSWSGVTVTPTKETTNVADGKQAANLAPSAQTFTLSNDVTPTIQIGNTNMEASCKIKTTVAGVQVCARQAGVTVNTCTPVPTDGNWDYVIATMTGPASGSVGVSVTAPSAVTGTIYVDDCYVGPNRNLGTVQQAFLVGQITMTGSGTNWSTSSTGLNTFGVQTGVSYTVTPGTLCTAPGTNLPAIVCPYQGLGHYVLKYEGLAQDSYTSSTQQAQYRFWDGTNNAVETTTIAGIPSSGPSINSINNSITYSSALAPPSTGNITFSIRGGVTAAGSIAVLYGNSTYPGTISVYYFPTSNQQVYNAGTAQAIFNGLVTGTMSTTSTTPAEYTTSGLSLATYKNLNFGTVTVRGSGDGLLFTPPRTGTLFVCVTHSVYNTSTGTLNQAKVVDGSGNIIIANFVSQSSTASASSVISGCGTMDVTPTAQTLKILGAADSGTTNVNVGSQITMHYIEQNVNTPILVQNSFNVSYGLTTGQVVGANSVLKYDTPLKADPSTYYSTSTGLFTAPGPCLYQISLVGNINTASTNTLYIKINGTAIFYLLELFQNNTSSAGIAYPLSKGDTVGVYADAGATFTSYAAAGSRYTNMLSISCVGN